MGPAFKTEISSQTSNGSVMVWEAGFGPLVRLQERFTGEDYRRLLVPATLRLLPRRLIFQHDNAPIHRAKVVQYYLRNQNSL